MLIIQIEGLFHRGRGSDNGHLQIPAAELSSAVRYVPGDAVGLKCEAQAFLRDSQNCCTSGAPTDYGVISAFPFALHREACKIHRGGQSVNTVCRYKMVPFRMDPLGMAPVNLFRVHH